MLSFLFSFSDSFLLAILLWPFFAALLTLPVLIFQYRKFNRITFKRSLTTYIFILYLLALVSFTLYPMPDNPAVFCADYHLSPQLNPLQFISDIQNDGVRAILQIFMNFVFFVPLGFFARVLFRWRIWPTILIGFMTSLFIETAQLTGAFGFYPCSYRLFDVDDLLTNTIGCVGGYLLAMLVPRKEIYQIDQSEIMKKPGLIRMLVALIIDQSVVWATYAAVLLAVCLSIGHDPPDNVNDLIYGFIFAVIHLAVPFFAKGKSIGSNLVRFTHDNKERSFAKRILFYLLRLLYIYLLIMTTNPYVSPLMLILTIILWRYKKILPYQVL